jgi:hypothetical protein
LAPKTTCLFCGYRYHAGVFENRREPILPTPIFIRRLLVCLGLALAIIAVALSIGVSGYHFIAGLPWIDALLNASMILAGMGPVTCSGRMRQKSSPRSTHSSVAWFSFRSWACCCRPSHTACCTGFT